MPPQTPEALERIAATTRRARSVLGMPGVSWARAEELERLMSIRVTRATPTLSNGRLTSV